jgi:hypothetical protein
MRPRSLASGVRPGDLKSPDLPIVDTGPFLASIRNFSFKPKNPYIIAMAKLAMISSARCRVIDGPCTLPGNGGSFLRPVHPAYLY